MECRAPYQCNASRTPWKSQAVDIKTHSRCAEKAALKWRDVRTKESAAERPPPSNLP